LASITERRKAAAATSDKSWQWFVEMHAHTTGLEAGDITLSTESLHNQMELCEHVIAPNQRAFTLSLQAWTAFRHADLARASRLSDQAAAVGGPDDMAVAAHRAALEFALHRETGSSNSRPDLDALRWWPVAVEAMQALLDLDAGDQAVARHHLSSIALSLPTVPFDNAYLHTMMLVGDVAARLRDKQVCADVAERLAPWAEQIAIGMTGQGGSMHRVLGLTRFVLGDTQSAIAELTQAIEASERLDAPLWSLRARLDRVGLHTEIGERDAADELANIAHAAATMGLTRIAQEAQQQAASIVTL
jgi:tetratricopeptide (TPR) repeat protein